jgi:ribosomal protein S18 acetylase RimI-like enzyme
MPDGGRRIGAQVLKRLDRSDSSMRRLLALIRDLDPTYVPPISSRTDLRTYCEKLIRRAEVFILEDPGTEPGREPNADIGFVAFYANDRHGGSAFVSSIGIRPQHRRKGIGAALLDAAVEVCRERGMRRVLLEVADRNTRARGFYRKYGFTDADLESPQPGHMMMVLEIAP